MRSTLEEEEELAPLRQTSDRASDREFTLSSTTLLAIFFGLALICALFFAFGYTLGRRSPAGQEASSPQITPETSPSVPQPSSSQNKPSAASQSNLPSTPPPGADETTSADSPDGAAPGPTTSVPASNTKTVSAAIPIGRRPAATALPARQSAGQSAAQAAPQFSPPVAPPTTGVMVQIAAVSNPADADVLVSALHKRGYSVTVRRDPADSLMHVQIGPFSSRADAVAMRQKLLADGYNAILK